MKPKKTPLRGSVTQNVSARARVREEEGPSLITRLSFFAGLLLALVVIGVIGWHSGWPQRTAERIRLKALEMTGDLQFEVKDIPVEGRLQSSKEEVLTAIGAKRGMPIFALDIDEAATRLSKLPWIKSAVVERRLPDTISVVLTEKKPMARWQRDQKILVIDDDGQILSMANHEDFPKLPLVVGSGANKETKTLLSLLNAYPEIKEKLESAVRVGERRWDLHLPPKIVVRLPENDVNEALNRLSVLMSEEKILERSLVAIDLRLADRLVLEPTPETKATGGNVRP